MRQRSLFEKTSPDSDSCASKGRTYWKLFIDGASRNNPGPAGAGIFLLKNDNPVERRGFFLGKKTNNQAEYLALVLGLFYLRKYVCKDDLLMIVSDSQLLVRQVQGVYKIKNAELKALHRYACTLLNDVSYTIVHVLREENKDADALANEGIDKHKKLPSTFLDQLETYGITV